MDPGRFDRQVKVLRKTEERTPAGAVKTELLPHGEFWMAFEPVRGTESFAAQQRFAEVEARFTGWYVPGLTPVDALELDGRVYDVIEVIEIPGGRPEQMQFMAKARAE